MKKVIALLCVTTLLLFSFVPFTAEASDNILRIVNGYMQSSIKYAYEGLSDHQKDICDFLVGLYNLTYLGERGFSFSAGEITDFSSFKVTCVQLGARIMEQTGISGWASRMSDVFCAYVSSCIQYAQQQSSDLNTWYQNLPSDFAIPYGKEIYDAWNNFYNDLSNDGIKTFQISEGEWTFQDVGGPYWAGYPWQNSSYETVYNNFIVNNSPVLYTSYFNVSNFQRCYVLSVANVKVPDSIFLLRNSPVGAFVFGNSDLTVTPTGYVKTNLLNYNLYNGSQTSQVLNNQWGFNNPQRDLGSNHTNYVDDAYYIGHNISYLYGWDFNSSAKTNYTLKHVFLVDNLTSLSNPEEILPTYGVNINSDDTLSVIPKEDMLFYIKKLETNLPFPYPASDPVPVRNIVVNNTYNYYGDQADPSTDFETAVIDRSAQSFSEPYSVDEGMFTQASEYIMYLWENTKPLILYTKDLLECLTISPIETDEETDGSTGLALAIYGSLAVGVAGGLISKLLL